jgi:hypothetical protein
MEHGTTISQLFVCAHEKRSFFHFGVIICTRGAEKELFYSDIELNIWKEKKNEICHGSEHSLSATLKSVTIMFFLFCVIFIFLRLERGIKGI